MKRKKRKSKMNIQELLEFIFTQTIVVDSGCVLFTGYTNAKGYGRLSVAGKQPLVHRLILEHELGASLTQGMCALHSCDTPRCINPKHLFAGTQVENIRDMCTKKRNSTARGEANGNTKILGSEIPWIFDLYKHGFTQTEIGELFGVSDVQISYILSGKSRKNESDGIARLVIGRTGEHSYFAKLSGAQVLEIRALCSDPICTLTQKEIAEKFNVMQSSVSRIHLRKIWKHI